MTCPLTREDFRLPLSLIETMEQLLADEALDDDALCKAVRRAVGGTPWPAALARRISARMPSQSWASVSVPSASSWLMPVRTGVGSLPSAMGHLLISEPHQQQAQPVQRQSRVELVLGEPRHAGQFGPCA